MTCPHNSLTALTALFPDEANDWSIDWNVVQHSELRDYAQRMAQTPQNPEYHAEGDVWTHTKLVCETLAEDKEFRALTPRKRHILFLAALLHDVGKIWRTTTEPSGALVSPGHARAGASDVRAFLWRSLGLCGAVDRVDCRETICALIRAHSTPSFLEHEHDWRRRLTALASLTELAPSFSLNLLFTLARADVCGRVAPNKRRALERVTFGADLAREVGLYDAPPKFFNARARWLYLNGREIDPALPVYDESWGEVVMLAGLAGVGKDYWISRYFPDALVLSLDDVRAELDARQGEKEGAVVELAYERAKEALRCKRAFVWNATSLSTTYRARLSSLAHRYNATLRIIYLETEWSENLRRNASRTAVVPQYAIEKMILKLEPPTFVEAENVEWRGN